MKAAALELVAVNPSVVIGPVLGSDFSFSIEVIKKLLDGSVPGIPRFGFDLVDVRDIARLHVLSMITPSAAGHRFIGAGEFLWGKEIASILKQGLVENTRKVPSMVVPDFLVRIVALFDPAVRSQLFNLGQEKRVSSPQSARNARLDHTPGIRKHHRYRSESSGEWLGMRGRDGASPTDFRTSA